MREDDINASIIESAELFDTHAREDARWRAKNQEPPGGWNQEKFAQEQIRGLVQQVFFARCGARQVVFSGIEPETDVGSICRKVGDTLARETAGSVAVGYKSPRILQQAGTLDEPLRNQANRDCSAPLRVRAVQVRGNFWLVPGEERNREPLTAAVLHSHLRELRAEFEYSIVEGPAVGQCHEATAMAQFADGIILVLSATRTRRPTARKLKESLEGAQVRILGAVLSDRVFPVPEAIYRRL